MFAKLETLRQTHDIEAKQNEKPLDLFIRFRLQF